MKKRTPLLVGAIAVLLSGCGGGSETLKTGNAIIPVFFSDAANSSYSHAYVTIYSMTLRSNLAVNYPIYANPKGLIVDVGALHDSSGPLFQFFANLTLPQDGFIKLNMSIGKNILFIPKAGGATSSLPITNLLTGDPGQVLADMDISPVFVADGTSPLVIDFPLSKWAIKPAGVTFTDDVLNSGPANATRQLANVVQGTTSGVFGALGAEVFNLKFGSSSIKVTTDPNTVILRSDGGPNPTLANGQSVHVIGQATNGSFVASRVIIDGNSPVNSMDALAPFMNVSPGSGTFSMTLGQSDGFQPTNSNLNVASNASSVYFSAGGVPEPSAQFFAELSAQPAGSATFVQGNVNGTTMTAREIYQLPVTGQQHKIEAGGTVSNINGQTATMTLKVLSFQGATLHLNAPVSVLPNPAATFEVNGQMVSQSVWLAGVVPGVTNVHLFGYLNGTTLSATRFAIGSTATDNGDAGDTL